MDSQDREEGEGERERAHAPRARREPIDAVVPRPVDCAGPRRRREGEDEQEKVHLRPEEALRRAAADADGMLPALLRDRRDVVLRDQLLAEVLELRLHRRVIDGDEELDGLRGDARLVDGEASGDDAADVLDFLVDVGEHAARSLLAGSI